MPKLGLTHRLLLITLVTLTPMAALMAINIYQTRETAWEGMHDTARRTGLLTTLELSQIIGSVENVLVSASASPSVRRADSAECSDFLATVTRRLTHIAAVTISKGGRGVICTSERVDNVLPAPDAQSVDRAVASGQATTGLFIPAGAGLPPTIPIVLSSANTGAGMLFVGYLDLAWLNQRLKAHPVGQNGSVTMADRQGTIIARHPLAEDFVGTKIPPALLNLVTAAEPGSMAVTSRDGTRRVIGYYPASPATKDIYVSAGVAMDEILAPINRITALTILVAMLTILSAVVVAQVANTRFIRQPFAKLIATLQAWQQGRTDQRTGL